jgi:hypothetical protein
MSLDFSTRSDRKILERIIPLHFVSGIVRFVIPFGIHRLTIPPPSGGRDELLFARSPTALHAWDSLTYALNIASLVFSLSHYQLVLNPASLRSRDNSTYALMSLDFSTRSDRKNLKANYPAALRFGDCSLWNTIRDPQAHYPATFRWQGRASLRSLAACLIISLSQIPRRFAPGIIRPTSFSALRF